MEPATGTQPLLTSTMKMSMKMETRSGKMTRTTMNFAVKMMMGMTSKLKVT